MQWFFCFSKVDCGFWTGKNNQSVGKMGKTSLTVYTCMDKLYCKLNWFFLTPKNNKQFLDFFRVGKYIKLFEKSTG